MCDFDCNHENNFCAEGLTCSTLGVCQNKSSQTNCTSNWLMHPPHIVAVLVIVMVVVCVCGVTHACSKHKTLEAETILLAELLSTILQTDTYLLVWMFIYQSPD